MDIQIHDPNIQSKVFHEFNAKDLHLSKLARQYKVTVIALL